MSELEQKYDIEGFQRIVRIALHLGDQRLSPDSRIRGLFLLLDSGSALWLDAFSLSAKLIHDRVHEILRKFPELDRESAFRTAVLEELEKQM